MTYFTDIRRTVGDVIRILNKYIRAQIVKMILNISKTESQVFAFAVAFTVVTALVL